MEIKISSEQEAALNRSNESANADPLTRPTLEQFVQSMFDEKMNEHVRAWSQRDSQLVAVKLATSITTMTKEDKDVVVAILDKYQIKPPTEIQPTVDPIIEEVITP